MSTLRLAASSGAPTGPLPTITSGCGTPAREQCVGYGIGAVLRQLFVSRASRPSLLANPLMVIGYCRVRGILGLHRAASVSQLRQVRRLNDRAVLLKQDGRCRRGGNRAFEPLPLRSCHLRALKFATLLVVFFIESRRSLASPACPDSRPGRTTLPAPLCTVTSKCASAASPTTRGATYGLAVNGQQGFFERKVCANDQRAATRLRYSSENCAFCASVQKNWRDVLARHPHRPQRCRRRRVVGLDEVELHLHDRRHQGRRGPVVGVELAVAGGRAEVERRERARAESRLAFLFLDCRAGVGSGRQGRSRHAAGQATACVGRRRPASVTPASPGAASGAASCRKRGRPAEDRDGSGGASVGARWTTGRVAAEGSVSLLLLIAQPVHVAPDEQHERHRADPKDSR